VQNGQVGITRDECSRARDQRRFDEFVVLWIAANRLVELDWRHPKSGTPRRVQPRLNIGVETFLDLDFVKQSLVFGEDVIRNDRAKEAVQPSFEASVGFAAPEYAGYEHAGINDGEIHLRTLRSARSTMAAACFAVWRPAGGWDKSFFTRAGGGGLTGSITSASPTSNTLTIPPLSRPWRLHQSCGKTDCRFSVNVIVIAFMDVTLFGRTKPVNAVDAVFSG